MWLKSFTTPAGRIQARMVISLAPGKMPQNHFPQDSVELEDAPFGAIGTMWGPQDS